jgi:iron complex transport system ATP-binding protein
LDHGAAAAVGTPAEAITPDVLARVYGVTARLERVEGGRPQVVVDGLVDEAVRR